MKGLEALLSLPTAALVGLGALAVVQITLDVIAFVDLYKRPKERLILPNKWIWGAIILLAATIGAVVYLAAARKPAPAAETRREPAAPARASEAVDLLYGKQKDAEKT